MSIMSVFAVNSPGTIPPTGTDFTIVPAVGGVLNWSFATNGTLNIATHGEWTITVVRTVTVNAKMWGGGGGPGGAYDLGYPPTTRIGSGGGGGFAGGRIQLPSGTVFKLRVGQGGSSVSTGSGVGATYLSGGVPSGTWGAEGGGYTGIFQTSVLPTSVILIAAGGGGGSDRAYSADGGGAGGGLTGQSAVSVQGGGGGTQTAGGSPSIYNSATAGAALQGGLSGDDGSVDGSLGGGGGGYWGGGGGNVGGGGGGSSYASVAASNVTLTRGFYATPGNASDPQRGASAAGGTGSTSGTDGRVILAFFSEP